MKRFKHFLAALFLILPLVFTACSRKEEKLPDGLYARIKTARGEITVNLEYKKAPMTVTNFVGLAEGSLEGTGGLPFYDGLIFHRVEEDFAIMGGDPAGNGTGDPGWLFPDEIVPEFSHDMMGVVGMSNYGRNTNGSQFYITLAPALYLDGSYTVFGNVIRGLDILKKIKAGDRITSIRIERVGEAAKAFKADQESWNTLYAEAAERAVEENKQIRAATIRRIQSIWPELEEKNNGFLVHIMQKGTGQKVRRFGLATVDYIGMLPDGTVFDQSRLHGGPIQIEVGTGYVIPGWDLILADMQVGERRLVAIPPEFGYGSSGYGGVIPGNSYLIFELEVTAYEE